MDEARFTIEYLGEVLDEHDTRTEAVIAKWELVRKIMGDKLPDFLTHDDFENDNDCANQICVVERR